MAAAFSLEQRVGEVADTIPHAARVFELVGVDYCCRRDRSLADAAGVAGLQPDEIMALLRQMSPPSSPSIGEIDHVAFGVLTRFIIGHHHRRTRSMLVNLTLLAARVASAHDVFRIQDLIERLARELIPHMRREEQYLFPYIDSLERQMGPDQTLVVPLFGTVVYPLQAIHHEHADDLAMVAAIREITNDFTPPEGACEPARELYQLLESFEREL